MAIVLHFRLAICQKEGGLYVKTAAQKALPGGGGHVKIKKIKNTPPPLTYLMTSLLVVVFAPKNTL